MTHNKGPSTAPLTRDYEGRQMSDSSKPPVPASAEPVSARIRARIVKAKRRFHANDNISTFIEPGELEALQAEVEALKAPSAVAPAVTPEPEAAVEE